MISINGKKRITAWAVFIGIALGHVGLFCEGYFSFIGLATLCFIIAIFAWDSIPGNCALKGMLGVAKMMVLGGR